jgi:hypothetical protein
MENIDLDSVDLEALLRYYYGEPPYLLMGLGLVASILSGLAFQTVLRELIQDWQKNRSTRSISEMRGWRLLTPFLGMAGGSMFFLAAGVQIFGLPAKFSYGLSFVLTVLIARLVWWQLGKLLKQLEEGGSAAIDLDGM